MCQTFSIYVSSDNVPTTTLINIAKTPTKKATLKVAFKIGGGGIRTHGTLARSTVFKTAPINRSGTPPSNRFRCIIIIPIQN